MVRRALRLSLLDGLLYAVMVGCSESYLGVLAVELGHQGTVLAVLATVPLAAGAFAQIASGWLSWRLGGRKRLVVVGVLIQAAVHLGFWWIAATEHRGLWALLLCKCLFWISGMLVAPAWSGWMASLVDGAARQRYFAFRSTLVQLALLMSFSGAGAYLQAGVGSPKRLGAFASLMSIALGARLASGLFLAWQGDPFEGRRGTPTPLFSRLRYAAQHASWRVAVYLALLGFGVYVAVPFFTPYMLVVLRLEYSEFAMLSAVSISCKALLFPLAHHIAARLGLRATLAWGGTGVAMLPLLWSLGPNFAQLLWIHALGGVAWAALEYASFQLLLACSDEQVRVDFLALASSLQGMLQLLGSLLGGMLLDSQRADYSEVFVLSCIGRTLPLLLLVTLPFPRQLKTLPRLVFRLLGVTPVVGPRFRPVIPEPPRADPSEASADAGAPTTDSTTRELDRELRGR